MAGVARVLDRDSVSYVSHIIVVAIVEKGGYYYYYYSRDKPRLGPLALTRALIGPPRRRFHRGLAPPSRGR